MDELIYVVMGYSRRFTGECSIEIIGVRRTIKDAQKLGWEWTRDKNEQYKAEGLNVHASYQFYGKHLK